MYSKFFYWKCLRRSLTPELPPELPKHTRNYKLHVKNLDVPLSTLKSEKTAPSNSKIKFQNQNFKSINSGMSRFLDSNPKICEQEKKKKVFWPCLRILNSLTIPENFFVGWYLGAAGSYRIRIQRTHIRQTKTL